MSGALQAFFSMVAALFALPTATTDTSAGTQADASASLASDGSFTCQGSTSGVTETGNWITPTSLAPGAYTIRLHVNSGSTPSGPAVDTDHALSTTRTWTLSQVGVGTNTSNCTLTLKDGSGNTMKTGTLTFTADRIL